MYKSKMWLISVVLGVSLVGSMSSVAATSRPLSMENPDAATPSLILYDCGGGWLQEDCSDYDSAYALDKVGDSILQDATVLAGYNKQFTCANGWVVTSPKYCPEAKQNQLAVLDKLDTLPEDDKPGSRDKDGDGEPDDKDYTVVDEYARFCLEYPYSKFC